MASSLRKKMFRWKESDDLELLKLVAQRRPTTTSEWEELSVICSKTIAEGRDLHLTKRGCVDRFKLLLQGHEKTTNKNIAA